MLLDGPIAVPSPLRRPFRFSSGKFRAAVVASLRGRCPSKPSSSAVCLRSERSEVRRATHVRPVSWHLCFRPRQLPREGTCSSSSHASPLLLPSGHLVVPLSPSLPFSVFVFLFVWWFVGLFLRRCLSRAASPPLPRCRPYPRPPPVLDLHLHRHRHLYLHVQSSSSCSILDLAYPRVPHTSHTVSAPLRLGSICPLPSALSLYLILHDVPFMTPHAAPVPAPTAAASLPSAVRRPSPRASLSPPPLRRRVPAHTPTQHTLYS